MKTSAHTLSGQILSKAVLQEIVTILKSDFSVTKIDGIASIEATNGTKAFIEKPVKYKGETNLKLVIYSAA